MNRDLKAKFETLKANIVGEVMNPKMSNMLDQVDALKREFELEEQSHDAEINRIAASLGFAFSEKQTIEDIVKEIHALHDVLREIRRVTDFDNSGYISIVAHLRNMKMNLDYFRNPWKLYTDMGNLVDTAVKDIVEKLGKLQSEKEKA